VLSKLLEREKYQTVAAFDENDVFVKLRHLKQHPILAIVDLNLTGSNQSENLAGYAVLEHLRKLGIYAIVLTGFAPRNAQFFADHPEILDVVDKMRFTDPDFEAFFLKKLHDSVVYAEAARYAEGKTEMQQELM
ncbi:MAG: hypothetical protein AAF614_43320, partial [Chloroflexota bacterium]